MIRFFFVAVRDAHADVFAGPISWFGAAIFVVCNWKWLRRQYAAGWPLPPV
jgi:hypothetical protein